MEQFVLVPASVYNDSLITQSVTKQNFLKYQLSWKPTYQIDSHKKEINKNLFAKADTSADENLFFPRIKLSNSQTLIVDGVETRILLSDFAQHFRRKNSSVLDIYFISLDAARNCPALIKKQNTKARERGSWVPSKIITSEIAKAVHAGRCCL